MFKTKWETFKENISEKFDDVVDEHPNAVIGAGYAIGAAVFVPLCCIMYRLYGKAEGKAIAGELIKAGVLGHPKD